MAKKILELAKRADQNAQLVIGFPRHQIAFHHLGEVRNRSLEIGEVPIILLIEPHPDKGRDRQAYYFRIDQCDIAQNYAASLKLANTAKAGAGRKADFVRQILVGDTTIVLKEIKYLAIKRIWCRY